MPNSSCIYIIALGKESPVLTTKEPISLHTVDELLDKPDVWRFLNEEEIQRVRAELEQSEYYTYINSNVLEPLNKFHQEATDSGKIEAFEQAIEKIENLFVSEVEGKIKLEQKNIAFAAINYGLREILDDLENNQKVGKWEKPVLDFFKAVVGVLISAPLLFAPLFNKEYRGYFFHSQAQKNVVELRKTIESRNIPQL